MRVKNLFYNNDVAEFNLLQENVKNNLVNTELIVNNQNVNIMLTKIKLSCYVNIIDFCWGGGKARSV